MIYFCGYKLITSDTPASIEKLVNRAIDDGWQPIGPCQVAMQFHLIEKGMDILYAQSIGLPDPDLDPNNP